MRKIRKFNGEDESEVSDKNLNQLRQDQTDRMMRLAKGESGNAPAASVSRSTASAAPAEAKPAPAEAPAAPKAKPPIVTLQQLNAFKKEFGADKDLTDYMNKQQGNLKRRNAPSPSTPSSSGGSGGGRGLTAEQFENNSKKTGDYKKAEEEARSEAGKARRAAMEKSQALEGSYPVENLAGGAAGLLKAGAGKLFGREAAEEFVKRGEPIYREPKLEILKDISQPLALPKPTPRLGYDKAGAKAAERSGRAAEQRAEMLKENARRSGLREDASAETSKAVRDKLGGNKFKIMKKGGAVKSYASGGSVSASSRGDGIAQRGKTRGRMC